MALLLVKRRVWLPSNVTPPAPLAPKSARIFDPFWLLLRKAFSVVPKFRPKLVEPKGATWSTPP